MFIKGYLNIKIWARSSAWLDPLHWSGRLQRRSYKAAKLRRKSRRSGVQHVFM